MQRNDRRLLSATQIAEWIGKHRSWIYREVRETRFPQPRKIGGTSRWDVDEVQAWIDCQPRGVGETHDGLTRRRSIDAGAAA